MRPSVSVIIPSYNSERYIQETIRSVLAQTHRPLEVIVVDDGSTDATVKIASGFGEPVRVERQRNQQVCRTRNRGFGLSRGEFVCFLDHDDYWYPWKLERQLAVFRAMPDVGVVYTSFLNWFANDGEFPAPESFDIQAPTLDAIDQEYSGWIYHHFLITCWALTSTAMIRRRVFVESGGFDPRLPYAEDWDLWLRISRRHQFAKLDAPSTLYRQHAAQGNRLPRDIDYRSRLLEEASSRYGLASPDGRSVDRRTFTRRLARYRMEYGLHQLRHGNRQAAIRSLWSAWHRHPQRLALAALIVLAFVGWKPKPDRGITT